MFFRNVGYVLSLLVLVNQEDSVYRLCVQRRYVLESPNNFFLFILTMKIYIDNIVGGVGYASDEERNAGAKIFQ
jgi:hypothetical protein